MGTIDSPTALPGCRPALRMALPLVIALLEIAPTLAQDAAVEPPIQTDRPTFSAGAALVPKRSFQLETGFKQTESSKERQADFGEVLLRYGLFSSSELRVAVNSYTIIRKTSADTEEGDSSNQGSTRQGLEDIALGAKIGLLREAKGAIPKLSLLPVLALATGSSEVTSDTVIPSLTVLLDWELAGPFSLSSNLGWERARTESEGFDRFKSSLALSFGLSDRLTGFAEVYALWPDSPDGGSESFADAGVLYRVGNTLSLDATFGAGLSGTDTDYFFGVGLGKRW